MSDDVQEIPEKRKKRRKRYTLWKPIFLVEVYRLARAGLSDEAIARSLNISRNTIKLWKDRQEGVREALELARKEVPSEDGFARYFYTQLDPSLQNLWDAIENNETKGGGIARLDRILADHGKNARQSLFLHALVNSHFSPTRAMERVGIDKRQLDDWKDNDPDFAQLVEDIQWHKGNYFEEALVKQVEKGNISAILFANARYNQKRGYGTKSEVDVTVSGEVRHTHAIDLAELDLSPACRLEIVQARRKKEQELENRRLIGRRPPEERDLRAVEDLIVQKAEA